MFGPVLYEAFCQLKATFDPAGVLNPGKIVDAPPLTANLRFGAAYRTARAGDGVRLCRLRRHGGSGGAVQWRRRLPQTVDRDDVSHPTWQPEMKPLRPAAGPMRCG